jgi:hypothetical protein
MPDSTNRTPIQIAWLNYVKTVQVLLVPQVDDRPLDQFIAFRDAVLILVQGEQFLSEINHTWTRSNKEPNLTEVKKALLLELESFPRAVEVAHATSKPEESKGWWKNLLGRASTVSGSVKDLMDDLPRYAKYALTLFRELIDLFRGKD